MHLRCFGFPRGKAAEFHYNSRPSRLAAAPYRKPHAIQGDTMRMNLKVPFAEKDQAKKLGARWDATLKVWYVAPGSDPAPFAQWSPTPHAATNISAPTTAPAKATGARQQASGKVFVGSAYVAQERVCDCPPWETCDKCAATALRTTP